MAAGFGQGKMTNDKTRYNPPMPISREQVINALRTVKDPELFKDIVSLNMVKDIRLDGDNVFVNVELTTPACPLKERIEKDIHGGIESGRSEGSDVGTDRQQKPTTKIHPSFWGILSYQSTKTSRKGVIFSSTIFRHLARKKLRKGIVKPSQLGIDVPTKQTNISQARIVPRNGYYVVEVVYEREEVQKLVDKSLFASIDIGVNNLVALTSNKAGFTPRLVKRASD